MGNCSGNCAACSGCAREMVLSPQELDFLRSLGEIPFQCIAREMGEDIPHFPESDTEEMTHVLQCLEKKGLISLDYDKPLRGCDYGPYRIQGSTALTERGQKVLEMIELQGVREE